MINFFPKDYKTRLDTINELESEVDDIDRVDFSKYVDSSTEGSEDFADQAHKAVAKSVSNAIERCKEVKGSLLEDVSNDFEEALGNYVFLVLKDVEEDENFPFRDWIKQSESLRENHTFRSTTILSAISEVASHNKELGISNLVNFLVDLPPHYPNNERFFPDLKAMLENNFPKVNLLDLLSATDYASMYKAMRGETVEVESSSSLFFKYASQLPSKHWAFKKTELDTKSKAKGFAMTFSTSNFNEIFEEFSKTDVWEKISKNEEHRKVFINTILKNERANNQFYSQRTNYGNNGKSTYIPLEVTWDNCEALVRHVLKEDVKLTEMFVQNLLNLFSLKEQEKMTNQATNLINMSLYHHLNKEVPQKDEATVKKHKI